MLKDKILVTVVTRNNPILLQHMFASFQRYNPGHPCDFLVVDHESTDKQHLGFLESLSKLHKVVTYENNRVEVSFNRAYQENKDYSHYFFLHDDAAANRDNWLKVFVDRMKSGHIEEIVKDDSWIKTLPIGRVGAAHQPWRNYSSILGYPVQCLFLEHVLKIFYQEAMVPKIFKFADPDRVLISNECLSSMNGIINVQEFKRMKEEKDEKYEKLCIILDRYLQYYDEGIPPKEKYPPGECWNKFTMTSEFLNSVEPLMNGYRTVGLEGDGYLEQIHGYDEPWGHNYIHHFGAPNMKQFLGKVFNTDANEVSKNFNNKIFLINSDKAIKEYFLRRSR